MLLSGCHSGVGSRLSGIESMEEAEREEEGEEEEEEESPKELEPEEEEMAMAGEGLGFCATGFGRKKEFAVKKSRFGVRLNSKRWKTDRQFHILRGASCRNVASSLVVAVCLMSINWKMKRRSGFGIIVTKTRGACVITIN